MEEWRPMRKNPKYEVSNLGRIRNKDTLTIRKTSTDKNGR